MPMPMRPTAWLALLSLVLAPPALADEKPGAQKKEQTPVGTWTVEQQQAPPKEGSLYEEALRAAPILWFSDDEPLLKVRNGTRLFIPGPLPCDPAADRDKPVVYYKLDNVRVNRALKPYERTAVYEGRLPLDSIRHMRINYYFYYPEDKGLEPHIHDIESISIELDVERDKQGRARVERNRVTGWAHGSELMANILQIKPSLRSGSGAPDTRSPITILVEEGKHASSPDRNGDGVYTPGVDVNVRVADAWGIRDVFGSGVIGSRYQAQMSKNRLTPVMAGTLELTRGLDDLARQMAELRKRVDNAPAPAPSPAAAIAAAQEAAAQATFDPGRYRIGPKLPADHKVLQTYEEERLVNGGLEYPSVQYQLRDITRIGDAPCATEPAPFPRGFKKPADGVADDHSRLDWKRQGHIFAAACPDPETPHDTTGRVDAGEDAILIPEPDSCGYLNLPASVAELQGRPPINRSKFTYKYGKWWPIQPFRNAFLGARYDRGGKGITAGFYSGYGLPKVGGWFNAGVTMVRRQEHWVFATNVWFTPSIATLATWYAGVGYDNENKSLADTTGHFALEGGVQVRHNVLGLRIGVRSRLSSGGLRNSGIVSEFVFGPTPRGTRVH